ncbi:MAG: leucine-rich repeat domain-containing protein [Eubacteriales bacterium]
MKSHIVKIVLWLISTLCMGCASVEEVDLAGTVIQVEEVPISENTYLIEEEFVLEKGSDKLIEYTGIDRWVTVPEGVTAIGENAFVDCEFSTIQLPSSVTIIETNAFVNCGNLSKVSIPSTLTYLGDDAFVQCESLDTLIIWESISYLGANEHIKYYMMKENTYWIGWSFILEKDTNKLVEYIGDNICIIVPEGVTTIGENAFVESDISTIEFPESVTTIETNAFVNCGNLSKVSIPSTLTYLGDDAFVQCESLDTLIIWESISYLGANEHIKYYMMSENTDLLDEKFIIEKDTNKLIEYIEMEKNFLVTVPEGVTAIGENAFVDCEFSAIEFPESVTTIETNAFVNCGNLSKVTIPSTLTYLGDDAFVQCGRLTTIRLPESITYIGKNKEIEYHQNLENGFVVDSNYRLYQHIGEEIQVVVPPWITSIETDAFFGSEHIESIVIPEGITYIGDYAFARCESLHTITLPEGITYIGKEAFADCPQLETVEIPKSVSHLDCVGLYTDVYIPSTVPYYSLLTREEQEMLKGYASISGEGYQYQCFLLYKPAEISLEMTWVEITYKIVIIEKGQVVEVLTVPTSSVEEPIHFQRLIIEEYDVNFDGEQDLCLLLGGSGANWRADCRYYLYQDGQVVEADPLLNNISNITVDANKERIYDIAISGRFIEYTLYQYNGAGVLEETDQVIVEWDIERIVYKRYQEGRLVDTLVRDEEETFEETVEKIVEEIEKWQ